MDHLLTDWAETQDRMAEKGKKLQKTIANLNIELRELEAPYRERIDRLEAEIKEITILDAETWKGDHAEARYRKGARRVTYDWRRVDVVRDVLHDILPETALALDVARKETTGKPSVKIVRV